MKNLSKFAFVALTALAVSFSSCKSETKTEGEGTTTESTDAMSTDSAATDAMTTDSAATMSTDSAAAQ